MARVAAIYARVSSDRQKESGTIASQTAALRERACKRGYVVPPEWVFEDDGFSGARLDRPGLEAVRDLAAEGRLEAVLVLSPDRLSRKYAYQVLLLEEFERSGVACEFVQTPAAETPQQRLLVQVQGMIAEYERAQIMERSRRGKRYKARQGSPSVLSGAPYGYRYVKRSEGMEARYEVLAREAEVVQQVFDWYAQDPCSIGEIARRLTEQGIPTRTGKQRWDRSVIWAMLRNPAYSGRAGYGKTGTGERQRVTRPLRRPGKYASRRVAGQERPREEWIEIPVPALVSAERFEQAREQLEANKRHSTRRTKEPTLLQGMLVCRRCGYAYYRASTRTTKRKLYYYRCLGTDGWRYEGGARCASRPVRQDRLDAVVWGELVRLLEDPALLEAELERRLEAGRRTDPRQRRVAELRGERKRLERAGARLVTAYQEELIGLDELRRRMPPLRSRTQAVEAELEAVESAVEERERHLRVAETLESFRERLRAGAGTLGVRERQKVLRALVKEVLVDDGEITIRHSIPVTEAGGSSPGKLAPNSSQPSPFSQSCLLRWGRKRSALRRPLPGSHHHAFHQNPAAQVPANQFQHPFVPDDGPDSPHHDVVMHPVKELLDVQIDDPVPASPDHVLPCRSHGIVSAASRSEPVAVLAEPRFEDPPQLLQQQLLDESIQHRGDPQAADPTVRFRDFHPPHWGHRVGPVQQLATDSRPVLLKVSLQFGGLHAVHPRRPPVAEYRSQGRPVVVRRDHLFHQRLVPLPSFRVFAATETRSPPFRLDGFHPWAFRTGARGSLPGSRLRSSWRLHWRVLHKVGTTPSVLRSTGSTRLLRYYDLC